MCTMHHLKFKAKDLKRVPTMAAQSDKRKALQREYVKIVKGMLKEDPMCAIISPFCNIYAQGMHHIIKRSEKNLCELNNLLRSCNACNLFLEEHDEWARAKGFVKSKFSEKTKRD
jgi:hypothetical protein